MKIELLNNAHNVNDVILQVQALLEQSDVYFGHGTDNALDEAAWLVSYATGLPPDFSDADLEQKVTDEQKQVVATLLSRRIDEHKPLAYLIHEAWFCGLKFYVDERVLVPRSPIAELIQEQFQPWLEPDRVHHILDLCTGSGCIAIACAYVFPDAKVDASDLSAAALEVAKTNIKQHALKDRMRLFQSDLFSGIDRQPYDLIVSNPPYVDAEDMAALPAEYHQEPALGLAAGEQGLDLVIPM
ncbi:MAG: 50S ribosomal protein L3 N(5)-glutamine methyltransferase, partial [Gammaproteobacteria bacterium]|nr:50S ribosomal protein L3 N(5)-glutamine methyltransferase [Gammaproteobacteria bacterium]